MEWSIKWEDQMMRMLLQCIKSEIMSIYQMSFKGQNYKVNSKKFEKVNLQQYENRRVGIFILKRDSILWWRNKQTF